MHDESRRWQLAKRLGCMKKTFATLSSASFYSSDHRVKGCNPPEVHSFPGWRFDILFIFTKQEYWGHPSPGSVHTRVFVTLNVMGGNSVLGRVMPGLGWFGETLARPLPPPANRPRAGQASIQAACDHQSAPHWSASQSIQALTHFFYTLDIVCCARGRKGRSITEPRTSGKLFTGSTGGKEEQGDWWATLVSPPPCLNSRIVTTTMLDRHQHHACFAGMSPECQHYRESWVSPTM